jgi:DNA-binding transcriptional ArsR family regulator
VLSSAVRTSVEDALIRFAWEEWSQMGVLAAGGPPRRWAQDPEALLLYTLEVGRSDPRLFDAVLDWLVTNEELVSLRRLRSLAVDPEDRALSDAVIAWLGRQRPKARFASAARRSSDQAVERLFLDDSFPLARVDEAFAEHGWLRPTLSGPWKSGPPDLEAPINLSFRLRHLLGLVARAEVVRLLLTMRDSGTTSSKLARSAGYTKRNVHEALSSLEQAGVIGAFRAGNELRYRIDHERWGAFLDVREPIEHVDWPPLLLSARRLVRWLRGTGDADLSDYLVASSARDLLERVRPDLEEAGVPVPRGQRAAVAVDGLLAVINRILELLDLG